LGLGDDFAEIYPLSRLIVIYASCLMVSKTYGLTSSLDLINEKAQTISKARS
jgi:hypothetical protein